jgi:hypothetical protein
MGVLAPQGVDFYDVSVEPTSEGPFGSWISISAAPGASPPLQIAVTGMVAPWGPFWVTPPLSHDFGRVSSGGGGSWKFEINALEPLVDLSFTAFGDVTIGAATSCTSTLAKGATCTVEARLVAQFFGPRSGDVDIRAGSAESKRVSVTLSAIAEEGSYP